MKEHIFNASLTIEATPEEAEALNKSNSTVDEETRQTFRHALEMQEASLPKGRIARPPLANRRYVYQLSKGQKQHRSHHQILSKGFSQPLQVCCLSRE